jgi:hypothetical protein
MSIAPQHLLAFGPIAVLAIVLLPLLGYAAARREADIWRNAWERMRAERDLAHDGSERAHRTVAILLSNILPEQHPTLLGNVVHAVLQELDRASELHPHWPADAIHAAAIVAEEAGELVQAANDWTYENGLLKSPMRIEAIQTGAMALRFLINLDRLQPYQSTDGGRLDG